MQLGTGAVDKRLMTDDHAQTKQTAKTCKQHHTWMVHSSSDESSKQVPTKSKDKHAEHSMRPCANRDEHNTNAHQRVWLEHVVGCTAPEHRAVNRKRGPLPAHITR